MVAVFARKTVWHNANMERHEGDRKPGQSVLSTLKNGLQVVELLTHGPSQVGYIADRLGLQRQSAYRILVTLRSEGWVAGPDHRDEYRLSGTFWSLTSSILLDDTSRFIYREVVNRVRENTAETVHLAIYIGQNEVLYIDKRDGTQPIRSYTALGGRSPAAAVATGKTLLAYQDPTEVDDICSSGLVSYSPRTIVDSAEFRSELQSILEQGFALNRGEWRADVGGIAVPLSDSNGRVHAALGVSGPVDRVMKFRESYTEALFSARNDEQPWWLEGNGTPEEGFPGDNR